MTEYWGIHNDQPGIDPIADQAVRVGWDEVGDLAGVEPTREAFKEALRQVFPDAGASVQLWAGTLYRFVHVVAEGDIVVSPDRADRTLRIGRVSGPYEYRPEAEQYRHWRPVEWIVSSAPRERLSEAAHSMVGTSTTLFSLTSISDELDALLDSTEPVSAAEDFGWVPFYEELADAVLLFRNDRTALIEKLQKIAETPGLEGRFNYLSTQRRADGTAGWLRDIDPFTVFSPFNRGRAADAVRTQIAEAYRVEFGITAAAPSSFAGVPVVNNMSSWFIRFEEDRDALVVDALWDLADAAVRYAQSQNEDTREQLVATFDSATRGNTRRLSMGIYWIRPETFAAYDGRNVDYLKRLYPDLAKTLALQDKISGEEFLANTEQIHTWLQQNSPHTSIPELSYAAWMNKQTTKATAADQATEAVQDTEDEVSLPGDHYTVDSLLEDGCFVPLGDLKAARERLVSKKNLIIQGPPGTGKTWLARRLAWTVCNERGSDRVKVIQLHPSMSYEDFVRGWRPTPPEGRLGLVDGLFLEVCSQAQDDPESSYVLVIEEINRGNPAQIFGELLTLLEADKRNEQSAMRLAYPRDEAERFYIPPNLYVIGTMNVADRSLALVDMALRRRFTFMELTPQFGSSWVEHVSGLGHDREVLEQFGARINALNTVIAQDRTLGRQFCIGHSFFTPHETREAIGLSTHHWLERVIDSEIRPLLEEYWFDPASAETVEKHLGSLRGD